MAMERFCHPRTLFLKAKALLLRVQQRVFLDSILFLSKRPFLDILLRFYPLSFKWLAPLA
jgi:hypothetical protein